MNETTYRHISVVSDDCNAIDSLNSASQRLIGKNSEELISDLSSMVRYAQIDFYSDVCMSSSIYDTVEEAFESAAENWFSKKLVFKKRESLSVLCLRLVNGVCRNHWTIDRVIVTPNVHINFDYKLYDKCHTSSDKDVTQNFLNQ